MPLTSTWALSPPTSPGPAGRSGSSKSFTFEFPIEIQKRILHFALALPPLHPPHDGSLTPGSSPAGQSGRQAGVRRVIERIGVCRSAMALMRVCKAWKAEAAPYLYAEPHLSISSLHAFAHALLQGDKKWSDINLHPHSTPGRYVITLDLTHLRDEYETIHPTTLSKILQSIFPLVPNLLHLVLPSGIPLSLEDVRRAPFARRLRSIQGLQVNYDISSSGHDPIIKLLRGLPNLEILSVHGPGDIEAPSNMELEENKQSELELPKLHTLILSGVKSGSLLSTLVDSELPALRNLLLTSYWLCADDLTYSFQSIHGHKITSLSYLSAREWPGFRALPPNDTLELHPNLLHLSYLLPKDLGHLTDILEDASDHSLQSLIIPKWTMTASDRWEADNSPRPQTSGSKRLMTTLVTSPPKYLEKVVIDGFRWVRADLGVRALQTGDSGEMRSWAEKLRVGCIVMVDMDGQIPPAAPVGIVGGNGNTSTLTNGMGMEGGKGRRRSTARVELTRVRSDELDEDGG